ncbi:MAG: hypothetical protein Q8L47_01425 [bacterium]|nr:hypothetical protein [bacterium]
MKKYILVGVLVASMALPMFAGATSTADLQALINSLMAQVRQLQAQLLAQQGGGTAPWCFTFNKNLGVGAKGDEMSALETVLSREGYSVEHSSNFASEYNERIASAVTGFQEKYKSEILTPNGLKNGTGYVGPSTRKKLNQLYGCGAKPPVTMCTQEAKQCSDGSYVSRTGPSCAFAACPTSQSSSITVLSPNWKEVYKKGDTAYIRWNVQNIGNATIEIDLMKVDGTLVYNLASMVNPYTGSQVNVNGAAYSWTIPTDTSPGGRRIDLGQYLIKISLTGDSSVFDAGDAPFSIVSSIAQPYISSLSRYSGVGTILLEINGSNFVGFEGDLNAWIENSQGVKGLLRGQAGSNNNLLKVTLSSPLCKQDNSYSGLECSSWLNLTPGTYKIYVETPTDKSNIISFSIVTSLINFHPADTNSDYRIGISEVTAYGQALYSASAQEIWKNSESYAWNQYTNDWMPQNPADTNRDGRITVSEATSYSGLNKELAGDLWKYGEFYAWQSVLKSWTPYHPADTNHNLKIEINELTSYGQGQYNVSAQSIWRNGENYGWDTAKKDWMPQSTS